MAGAENRQECPPGASVAPERSTHPAMHAAVGLGFYVAVALLQTAPLALHLTTSIPFGNGVSATVPRLNLWTLWWNSDRLLHAYHGYWQAPVFYPEPYSFVYSETQWLTGLLASPLFWMSGNPALTYDAVILAALTLTGLGGYVLLRSLGLEFPAALCGGVITEMLPTITDQLGVLQSTTVVFPILMALACLVRFSRTGRVSSALGIGLWMAACFHTSSNMALFFGPVLLLGLLTLAGRMLIRARPAGALAVAGLSSALLVAPIAIVQSRVLKTMPAYTSSAIAASSTHLGGYSQMAPTNTLRRRPPDRKEVTLGVGMALPALAALGVIYGLRRRHLRGWTVYSVLAVVACNLVSFGPLLDHVTLGALLGAPYNVLRAWYPGFQFARNLWRFSALAQIFLAPLAAFGIAACFRGRGIRQGLPGALLTVAVGLDLLATPIPLLELRENQSRPEWVQWLTGSPPQTTVVHIPMPTDVTDDAFERTAFWMDCQIYHGRRIANGYAAYIPSRTALLLQVMPGFPDVESLRALQYFGIDHVAAGSDWLTPESASRVAQWSKWVVPELVTDDMTIYRILGAVPQPE